MGICFGPGRVTGIGGSSHHEAIKKQSGSFLLLPGSGTDWRLLGAGAAAQLLGQALSLGMSRYQEGKPFRMVTIIVTNEQGKKWELENRQERATLSRGRCSREFMLSATR